MQIRLYKFAKLLNSTATPDADGESSTALLKDSSPKDNPVFVIHRSKLKDYNYMKAEFDNETVYYFINSPTYLSNDLVEIPCTIDYLATYKQGIKSSAQYIDKIEYHYYVDAANSGNITILKSDFNDYFKVVFWNFHNNI